MRHKQPGYLLGLLQLTVLFLGVVMLPGRAEAQAYTYTKLHDFTGQTDGANPGAGVTIDRAGNLYGTTFGGGSGYGTVYNLKDTVSGWVFRVLYSFAGGNDGAYTLSRVVFGPNGSLYGSTLYGGGSNCSYFGYTGCGTIFNLQPPKAIVCRTQFCPWTESTLYRFQGGSNDGALPEGDLVFDQAGTIYGTTEDAGLYGTCNGFGGCGTAFALSPSNNGWNERIIWNFGQGTDGILPVAGVIFDAANNLVGVTYLGGALGVGMVYGLTQSGSAWTESILHTFEASNDGYEPDGGLLLDTAGNLYGSASGGGNSGGGTAFELNPSFNLLYSFPGSAQNGPHGKLVMDEAGNLYGATSGNGAYGYGAVFKLTLQSDGQWAYTSLYDFCPQGPPCADGADPFGNLAFDRNGNIYGTAQNGGADGVGVVFELSPN